MLASQDLAIVRPALEETATAVPKEIVVARIVKIPTPTGTIEGEEIQFKTQSEPWCSYQLEDGYTIRVKLVVTQIIKTSQKDADGNPVYFARSSNVMAVSPDNFIGRKFAAAQSVLAIYRERIDQTFKFYIVTTDETEEELNQLLGIEKDLYVVFPEDELDFEILLGQELACAVPSEATRIWQRT